MASRLGELWEIQFKPDYIYKNNLFNNYRWNWKYYNRKDSGDIYLISPDFSTESTFQYSKWETSSLRDKLQGKYNDMPADGKKCIVPQSTTVVTKVLPDGKYETTTFFDHITTQNLENTTTDPYFHNPISNFSAGAVIRLNGNRKVYIDDDLGIITDLDALGDLKIGTFSPDNYIGVIYPHNVYGNTKIKLSRAGISMDHPTHTRVYNYIDGVAVPTSPIQVNVVSEMITLLEYKYLAYMSSNSFLRVEVENAGRKATVDIKYKYDKNSVFPLWQGYDDYIGRSASRKFISDMWVGVDTVYRDSKIIGRVGGKTFDINGNGAFKIGMPYDFWREIPVGENTLTLIAQSTDPNGNSRSNARAYGFEKLSPDWEMTGSFYRYVIKNKPFAFSITTNDVEQPLSYEIRFMDRLMATGNCVGSRTVYVSLPDDEWRDLPLGVHSFQTRLTCGNTGEMQERNVEFEKLSDKLTVMKTVRAKKGTARIVVVYKATCETDAEIMILNGNSLIRSVEEEVTITGESSCNLTVRRYTAEITDDITEVDWILSIGKQEVHDEIYLEAVSFGVF